MRATLGMGAVRASFKRGGTPAWQRKEGKSESGGLNAKGRASYNKIFLCQNERHEEKINIS